MSAEASPRNALQGWTPILGAFSIWFAHFLVVYGAALIWPAKPIANMIALIATIAALVALAVLFFRLRAVRPASHHTQFARRFGLGSLFIATAAVLFDAAPALFG